ncbi:MAG: hypothetical protein KGJ78_09840 [Alphaproteobacteria bacterium]|nr:hypothetical protein [Alphaproteobacteria bacterium]
MGRMRALAALPFLITLAHGADADHDSRHLTAGEQRTFFPLVCQTPIRHQKDSTCAAVSGYPGAVPDASFNLSLTAVLYGAVTRQGTDEAYVTYAADFEPHANNFGGGILFARKAGTWRLVRWYPGGEMDRCLALPGQGPLRFLCLDDYMGQGEADSSVWLRSVPVETPTGILKAQDDREASDPDYQCAAAGKSVLLAIDGLKRSKAPGVFAESAVRYAKAQDAAAACRKHNFAHVRETAGVVRYELRRGRVVAVTPEKFAAADY